MKLPIHVWRTGIISSCAESCDDLNKDIGPSKEKKNEKTQISQGNVVLPEYKGQECKVCRRITLIESIKSLLWAILFCIRGWTFIKIFTFILYPFPVLFVTLKNLLTIPRRVEKGRTLGKKICIVGLHGWYPSRLIRRFFVEHDVAEKTTEQLVRMMKEAIMLQSRLEEWNIDKEDIDELGLIGEGTFEERVQMYSTNIAGNEDYIKRLQSVDSIFVVGHSQGTVVSLLLIDDLLQKGILDIRRHNIGVLSIAGVHHGICPKHRETMIIKYIEKNRTRDMFDLNDLRNPLSEKYLVAVERVLNTGVRLVCSGAWNDGAVSLYSSTLHAMSHHNIYRCIYIAEEDYVDDFLTRLIVFFIRVRNKGISDRGLLVYFSDYMLGTYKKNRHSDIYSEPNLFTVCVHWTLEGTRRRDEKRSKCFKIDFETPYTDQNMFNVPWLLNDLLKYKKVRKDKELQVEIGKIIKMYNEWTPDTERLIRLKRKLECLFLLYK
eukprot:GHVP01033334.1.p1 GENE.GHVP01033334.1~~GHVP01033334.1.p1  ORF type:complete len:490 (+),score=62.46 GHVP01033334.1:1085-2554(+)